MLRPSEILLKMRCHYEVLGVPRDVSESDLKKVYRRLALQYHPDKNPDNIDECTRLFNDIQQAYEVLSDPQERAWYDKHREEILRGAGSDYKDDGIDLMPYFSTSCFTGFGDDPKGFYAIYADVFRRITSEEAQYGETGSGCGLKEEDCLPEFGLSTSDYEETVHVFYGYWQSFFTRKSFVWEDEHNLKYAPNRRYQRAMEKENKKKRDIAKKKYNEIVRELVSFVRKRDKRVQAYKKLIEEREKERQQKVALKRARDRERRLREREEVVAGIGDHHVNASAQFEEDLQTLQARIEDELGKDSDVSASCSDSGDDLPSSDLFCPACNKLFKTSNAYSNHERSKKHRENVALLKVVMEGDEELEKSKVKGHSSGQDATQPLPAESSRLSPLSREDSDSCGETEDVDANMATSEIERLGVEERERREGMIEEKEKELVPDGGPSLSHVDSGDEDIALSSFVRNKKFSSGLPDYIDHRDDDLSPHPTADDTPTAATMTTSSLIGSESSGDEATGSNSRKKRVKARNKKKASKGSSAGAAGVQGSPAGNVCEVCRKYLPSRNKLFQHIKETGHAAIKEQRAPSLQSTERSRGPNKTTERKRTKQKTK